MISTPGKIAVVGAGSWGTTVAKILADAAASQSRPTRIHLLARRAEIAAEVNAKHQNSSYLPGTKLPLSILAETEPRQALRGADVVVLAVPAQNLRAQLEDIVTLIPSEAKIISLMKGMEQASSQTMSQVIAEVLVTPQEQIAVLSGPNLALEIAREEPTLSLLACTDARQARELAELFSTPYFLLETSTDVLGTEIGGIAKNVVALAVGMCEGLGLGDNTKASVMTRSMSETTKLVKALGGQAETVWGPAGLGDLIATCASGLSRNHQAGKLLGEGTPLAEVDRRMSQTAEGIASAYALSDFVARQGIAMPMLLAITQVLQGRRSLQDLAGELLGIGVKG